MASLPRLRENIFLIGNVDTQIVGNKLPSQLQALKVLFFYLRNLKSSLEGAITAVIEEVILFWKNAQIPTQKIPRCKEKLRKLYTEWSVLGKHKDRNESAVLKQTEFSRSVKNLLDIAHGKVFDLIDEQKRDFLINQRKETRLGFIADIQTDSDQAKDDNELSRNISTFMEMMLFGFEPLLSAFIDSFACKSSLLIKTNFLQAILLR